MKEIFDNLSRVFSNATRIQIMHLLNENPLTITELTAKISNVSASVTSRHLSVLDEHDFIVKKAATGRAYELSPFGESIYCMMKPLTFFLKHANFFKSHSLTSLPANFLCSINMLEHATFIEGTANVIKEINSYGKSIKQKSHYMSSQHFVVPNFNYEEIRVIYTEKLFEEIGALQFQKDLENSSKLSVDDVKMRLLPEIDIALAIGDENKKGLVVFPRNDGSTLDYAGMFIVEDEIGMEYLKRIWTYYWNKSEPVSLKT
ncbi:MAG: ArsR family transcriptional regulator [Candidatus Hodarchaeales archaeon]|jgi:predicted transcriptional regulator